MKEPKSRSSRCQVCRHPESTRIELMRSSGVSLNVIAEKFGVQRDAVNRHWHGHVSDAMKASFLAGPLQLEELAKKAADTGMSVLDHPPSPGSPTRISIRNSRSCPGGLTSRKRNSQLAAALEDGGWRARLRKEQVAPIGTWRIWLLLAGRGFGKTSSDQAGRTDSCRAGSMVALPWSHRLPPTRHAAAEVR